MANNNFDTPWNGVLTHDQVEAAIKAKVAELMDLINEMGVPEGGITIEMLANSLRSAINSAYQKPSTGIPASDLAQAVRSILNDVASKVDAVPGKGLSTNDFTNELVTKLEGIAAGAQVNVINGIKKYDGQALTPDNNGIVTLPNINGGETVVASVDDIDIVDNPNGQNADTMLAAASARMVKEIYINVKALYQNLAGMAFVGDKPTWQTVPVRTYTIGMASADSNITLTDGNGNAVTSPQPEGTPLTLRLSVANGYRFAAAPTALMGNTNIEFTLDGSYYVAVIGALAGNIVITASSVEMGTYGVNIPTGAVFCTSAGASASAPSIEEGDNVTCYIRPADGKRWSTTPTSSAATVTLQSGSIYKIVASNVQADITVSGSTEAIPTYNISVPNDAHITVDNGSGGSVPASVLEGTALTIRLTPAANYNISVQTATMENNGVATNLPNPTNVDGVLTYTIANVTGNIVITAVAEEMGKVTITKYLRNVTLADNTDANGKIAEGATYNGTVAVEDRTGIKTRYTDTSFATNFPAGTFPPLKLMPAMIDSDGLTVNIAQDGLSATINGVVSSNKTITAVGETRMIRGRGVGSGGSGTPGSSAAQSRCMNETPVLVPQGVNAYVVHHNFKTLSEELELPNTAEYNTYNNITDRVVSGSGDLGGGSFKGLPRTEDETVFLHDLNSLNKCVYIWFSFILGFNNSTTELMQANLEKCWVKGYVLPSGETDITKATAEYLLFDGSKSTLIEQSE